MGQVPFSFYRDKEEIFYRAWWFVEGVSELIAERFYEANLLAIAPEMFLRDTERLERSLLEAISYSMSFALAQLRGDIENLVTPHPSAMFGACQALRDGLASGK